MQSPEIIFIKHIFWLIVQFFIFVILGRIKVVETFEKPIFFYPRKFRELKLVRKSSIFVESPQIIHIKQCFWAIEKILILCDFRSLQSHNPSSKNMRVIVVFQ